MNTVPWDAASAADWAGAAALGRRSLRCTIREFVRAIGDFVPSIRHLRPILVTSQAGKHEQLPLLAGPRFLEVERACVKLVRGSRRIVHVNCTRAPLRRSVSRPRALLFVFSRHESRPRDRASRKDGCRFWAALAFSRSSAHV